MTKHERFMKEAFCEAEIALHEGECPVGAVIVLNDQIIARAHNQTQSASNPIYHAELLAIKQAVSFLDKSYLNDCTLYVTLEPCPMCAGAMILSRLGKCYFGARDERQGCCESVYALPMDPTFYHRLSCVGGLLSDECSDLLKHFFENQRRNGA